MLFCINICLNSTRKKTSILYFHDFIKEEKGKEKGWMMAIRREKDVKFTMTPQCQGNITKYSVIHSYLEFWGQKELCF